VTRGPGLIAKPAEVSVYCDGTTEFVHLPFCIEHT